MIPTHFCYSVTLILLLLLFVYKLFMVTGTNVPRMHFIIKMDGQRISDCSFDIY